MSDIANLLHTAATALRDYERDGLAANLEAAAEWLGEPLDEAITRLESKLAAAEADAVAQRYKVRVMRETLEQLLAYVETGYGDFGSDEGAQAHEALATTEDV